MPSALRQFNAATQSWFASAFAEPTAAQEAAWSELLQAHSTLLVAPTGSGKTLAAFLHAIDRLLFSEDRRTVLYISPLKALAVDVEKNLTAPLQGIRMRAEALGIPCQPLSVALRTGDTSAKERASLARKGADIIITTPESLYLMLTSRAHTVLANVGTVIIDEIHTLVPSKRGAHLMVSLERLQALVPTPIQRIGLSATQRPLDEVARFLGGADVDAEGHVVYRPVALADGRWPKSISVSVQVPVEDMARIAKQLRDLSLPESEAGSNSMWSAIHPALLEQIRTHQTTLIFVNSRRLAERLALALNDLAGETWVQAHHGSLAREQRTRVEEALKAGQLRGLVATSSLELGIDMGSVDLVIQLEAPPSVASGIQRIGRAGHQVGAPSFGVIVPKFRHDLLACAALTDAIADSDIEATRSLRNPLDVLCQQIVAICSQAPQTIEGLYRLLRGATAFAELSFQAYERCLDLLSGRYESDDFADLRPRLTVDRTNGKITARPGAQKVAILNGGTIPDRGLYGVFLQGAPKGKGRVGELDEEMVFECKSGETFTLGASTWRIEEITFDKVIVSPAPGQPGKMPFWKGENVLRPIDFGRRIGELTSKLSDLPAATATTLLKSRNGLDDFAAENLTRYLAEQKSQSGLPDDKTVVVEMTRDEVGDWRICLLSPYGGQVLAPWSIAIAAAIAEQFGIEVETVWTNDGLVVRVPEMFALNDLSFLTLDPERVESLLLGRLAKTPMFAARFREAAGRALLFSKRRPGQRTPLWQTRKKSTDLLAAASRYESFPIILETYREILSDVFDMPALKSILSDLQRGVIALKVVTLDTPSPFANALLFGYTANFLYEGDLPPAERKAQALSIDINHLKDLLGHIALREFIDVDIITEVEAQLQGLGDTRIENTEALYDLLLRLGDLTEDEIKLRSASPPELWIDALIEARRAHYMRIGGEQRLVANEFVSRYTLGLGLPAPRGYAAPMQTPSADPLGDIILRYARSHGPFTEAQLKERYGDLPFAQKARELIASGRLISGELTQGRSETEYTSQEVLSRIQRRALASLRKSVEPAPPAEFTRALTHWQSLVVKRRGLDGLLDTIEQLEGLPLLASQLESNVLRARIEDYHPSMLDQLISAGEITWIGLEKQGHRDGLIALYLRDHLAKLRPKTDKSPELDALQQKILSTLRERGALFSSSLAKLVGPTFGPDFQDALWGLVFAGVITNDTFYPLRAFLGRDASPQRKERGFRSRRAKVIGDDGRWYAVDAHDASTVDKPGAEDPTKTSTAWAYAKVESLLGRYGVVTRQVADLESIQGGFSAIYDVFKLLEERGRIRRGYFVEGVAAMQFALGPAVELLRTMKTPPKQNEFLLLSAVDPANPYGAILPWPEGAQGRPMRAVGAKVVLFNGHLVAWLARGFRALLLFVPEDAPWKRDAFMQLANAMQQLASDAMRRDRGFMLETINGEPPQDSSLFPLLKDVGFDVTSEGLRLKRAVAPGFARIGGNHRPNGNTIETGAIAQTPQAQTADDQSDEIDLDAFDSYDDLDEPETPKLLTRS